MTWPVKLASTLQRWASRYLSSICSPRLPYRGYLTGPIQHCLASLPLPGSPREHSPHVSSWNRPLGLLATYTRYLLHASRSCGVNRHWHCDSLRGFRRWLFWRAAPWDATSCGRSTECPPNVGSVLKPRACFSPGSLAPKGVTGKR